MSALIGISGRCCQQRARSVSKGDPKIQEVFGVWACLYDLQHLRWSVRAFSGQASQHRSAGAYKNLSPKSEQKEELAEGLFAAALQTHPPMNSPSTKSCGMVGQSLNALTPARTAASDSTSNT